MSFVVTFSARSMSTDLIGSWGHRRTRPYKVVYAAVGSPSTAQIPGGVNWPGAAGW